MASSSDSSSPNKTLPSFLQNPPTSESGQIIQDQIMNVVDATTQEGGSSGEEGKKEGSDENIATEPSKVLDSGEGSVVGKTVANKNEREKSVVGEKKRIFIPIDSLSIDLRGELPPPRGQHQSMPQEKDGNGNKKVKVEEGSSSHAGLQGLDQKGWVLPPKSEFDDKSTAREGGECKIEDGENTEEKPKIKVEEAIVKEDKNEVMMPCAEEENNKKMMASAAAAVAEVETSQKNEAAAATATAAEIETAVKNEAAAEVETAQKNEAAAAVAEVETALKNEAAAATVAEVETALKNLAAAAANIAEVGTTLKYEAVATEKVEVEAEPAEAPLIEQQNDEVEVEAEPAETPLIEQQNDDAERIVRDIDLNELPPEYEEDN